MRIPPRDEFPAWVIKLVKKKFPLVKLAKAKDAFALAVNGELASLENLYRIVSLRPDEAQRHVNRWIVELLRAGERGQDQDGTFDTLRSRLLPLILSSRIGPESAKRLVTQPLVNGLDIAYAIDNDRTIAYLSRGQFHTWKITLDQLHETALSNLISRSGTMSAHAAQDDDGKVNLVLFQQMDGYDSSRILLPTLHERLREHLGSPFAVAIPNRDILICFRNDPEMVERLKQQIADDYQQMPHQVTDQLFLVTADGIAPLAI